MNNWREYVWVTIFTAIGFTSGFLAHRQFPPEVKEVVRWQTKTVSAVQASAASETKQQVRVVTKWLRPDGTTSKEETRAAALSSTSATVTERSDARLTSGQAVRVSESHTADRRSLRALTATWDARAPRRLPLVTGSVSLRLVGPLFVAGYVSVPTWEPRLSTIGASVGFAF